MQSRIIVTAFLMVGLFSAGSTASRGQSAAGPRTWTMVNFMEPMRVLDRIVMGPVLIVHDDQKMEQGEACTTFYRFDPARGPQEEIVSFHCTPVQREVAAITRLIVSNSLEPGCKRLIEYQIAGESEAHGIPTK